MFNLSFYTMDLYLSTNVNDLRKFEKIKDTFAKPSRIDLKLVDRIKRINANEQSAIV